MLFWTVSDTDIDAWAILSRWPIPHNGTESVMMAYSTGLLAVEEFVKIAESVLP